MSRSVFRVSTAAFKADDSRLKKAQRSSYFARREAAKVLQRVLQGDERRQAVGSIKTLVYSPSVRNKKATLALVCETLKRKLALMNTYEVVDLMSEAWFEFPSPNHRKKNVGLSFLVCIIFTVFVFF